MKSKKVAFNRIIFMKYGVHASENVESIILRKQQECDVCGYMFWGYGGTICHPLQQIKPFLEDSKQAKETVYLMLSKTPSKFLGESVSAREFSLDKCNWNAMPHGINVVGSKYALKCGRLIKHPIHLDMSSYCVALGNSKGKRLQDYVRSRVDKGCAIRTIDDAFSTSLSVQVDMYAEVIDAVFVR